MSYRRGLPNATVVVVCAPLALEEFGSELRSRGRGIASVLYGTPILVGRQKSWGHTRARAHRSTVRGRDEGKRLMFDSCRTLALQSRESLRARGTV